MTTRIINSQAIASIYGELPSFVGAESTEVRVARDEPRILVKLVTKRGNNASCEMTEEL
jgi:hypothetical protein